MSSARSGLAAAVASSLVALVLGSCAEHREVGPMGGSFGGDASAGEPPTTAAGESSGDGDGGADDDEPPSFDVHADDGVPQPCEEGGDCGRCEQAAHVPCDAGTEDPFAAMGLGCAGEPTIMLSAGGSADAIGVRTSFGGTIGFDPREGSSYAVIGSGLVSELDLETPDLDGMPDYAPHSSPTHCNDDLGDEWDPQAQLPMPLLPHDVGPPDCTQDPSLVGTGDCSNTIEGQFSQGHAAYDYTELRIEARVPDTASSIGYDFAFHSTEYPFYYHSAYNDMFVAWLESEQWTGNISFDEAGNPISLNAGFLDHRDDSGTLPEYAGTCMRYHAGTKWLSTTASVQPGEEIVVVLAIFDLSDSILDSFVFLDNWRWGCEGGPGPTTKPVG